VTVGSGFGEGERGDSQCDRHGAACGIDEADMNKAWNATAGVRDSAMNAGLCESRFQASTERAAKCADLPS